MSMQKLKKNIHRDILTSEYLQVTAGNLFPSFFKGKYKFQEVFQVNLTNINPKVLSGSDHLTPEELLKNFKCIFVTS